MENAKSWPTQCWNFTGAIEDAEKLGKEPPDSPNRSNCLETPNKTLIVNPEIDDGRLDRHDIVPSTSKDHA